MPSFGVRPLSIEEAATYHGRDSGYILHFGAHPVNKEYVDKVRCERKPDEFRKYEKVGFATPTGKRVLFYKSARREFNHSVY